MKLHMHWQIAELWIKTVIVRNSSSVPSSALCKLYQSIGMLSTRHLPWMMMSHQHTPTAALQALQQCWGELNISTMYGCSLTRAAACSITLEAGLPPSPTAMASAGGSAPDDETKSPGEHAPNCFPRQQLP